MTKRQILLLCALTLSLHGGISVPNAHGGMTLQNLPALEELETAALQYAGLDPARLQGWQRGVKWAAALPQIQIGLESAFTNQNTTIIQDSISVTSGGVTIGPESSRIDEDFEDNRNFEMKAVWALDELLFNRDQLYISHEARDLYFTRTRLLQDLHQAYYDLKSLLLRAELDPGFMQDPIQKLRCDQLGDQLNSFTGGKFKTLLPGDSP
jgi:hypothetical protein